MDNDQSLVDESGMPAKKRFKTAYSAYSTFRRFHNAGDTDAKMRAKIQGMKDGNPPYSVSKQRSKGQAWRANVNFQEMDAVCTSNAASFWELIVEVPMLAYFNYVDYSMGKKVVNQEWSSIMEAEFTKALLGWEGFHEEVILFSDEMVTYGRGPTIFKDPFSFQFCAIKESRMVMNPKSSSRINGIDLVFVQDDMKVVDLLKKLEGDEEGWDKDQIKSLLSAAYGGHINDSLVGKYNSDEYNSWAQAVKNNDYDDLYEDETEVNVIFCYYQDPTTRKFNVGVMAACIHDGKIGAEELAIKKQPNATTDWLYHKEGVYDKVSEFFNPFLYSMGDGYYKSVKGLGHKSYNHIELSNRLTCEMFNSVMLMSGLVATQDGDRSANDLRITKKGSVMLLPKGVTPLPTPYAPNISGQMSARIMLWNILNNNSGQIRAHNEQAGMSEKTAEEVRSQDARDAQFKKNQIMLYTIQWARLLRQVFHRLMQSTYPESCDGYEIWKGFHERLEASGIPKEFLKEEYWELKPVKMLGSGSPVLKRSDTREMIGLMRELPRKGQKNVIKDFIAARGDYDLAERYFPAGEDDSTPNNAVSFATMENNDMAQGQTCVVGQDQDHEIHFKVAVQPLIEFADQYNQSQGQMDPRPVLQYYVLGIEHAAQHLNYISASPYLKGKVPEYKKVLDSVVASFKKMQSDAEAIARNEQAAQKKAQQEQARMAQQQQQVSEKGQLEAARIQQEMAIKAQATQHEMALREAKAKQQMELKDMASAQKLSAKAREEANKQERE